MSSKIKWYLNGIAGAVFVIVVVIYLVIRPVVVQNLEPVLQQAAEEKLNGEISWRTWIPGTIFLSMDCC